MQLFTIDVTPAARVSDTCELLALQYQFGKNREQNPGLDKSWTFLIFPVCGTQTGTSFISSVASKEETVAALLLSADHFDFKSGNKDKHFQHKLMRFLKIKLQFDL